MGRPSDKYGIGARFVTGSGDDFATQKVAFPAGRMKA